MQTVTFMMLLMQNEASLVAGKLFIVWQCCSRQRFRLVLEVRTKCRTRKPWRYVFADVACQSELARGSKVEKECLLQQRSRWYVERQYTPYSLKVKCENRTRKRSRCVFGDIARQSNLACSSKVEKQCLLQQPSRLICRTLVYTLQFVSYGQKYEQNGISVGDYDACFGS